MSPAYKNSAIRYWEKRRLIYNVILVVPALVGWSISASLTLAIDDQQSPSLLDPLVILNLIFLIIGANICYSFVYSLEFLFYSESSQSWSSRGRLIILILGCLISIPLAGVCMGALQVQMSNTLYPY